MEHQYCLFYKNDRLQFGWIREVRKNRPVIVPIQGKEFSMAPNRLEYIWSGKSIQAETEALAYLSEKSDSTLSAADGIELGVIHELCDPGASYTLEELSENFLDDPDDGWSRVALLIKIKQDRKRFQQKKSHFVPRSEAEIRKLDEESDRKREHERKLAMESDWAERLLNKELPEVPEADSDHWQQFLQRILGFLRYMDSSQERDYFRTLFHCQGSDGVVIERRLLDVLSLAGINISWGQLVVSRVDAHLSAESDELAAIADLKKRDIAAGQFGLETRDQTALRTFTVDNAETRDYDDAISLEEVDGGAILRVHIADVASFIQRDDLLFQKSESRVSSLYTVKETYPMFHPDLSENVFSLKAGEDRPVMTFEGEVDSDGELKASRIYRSIVRVDQNLTYDAVDQALLLEDPFWTTIWRFCSKLKQKRLDHGSLELDRIEIKLDISDPDQIRIKEIRENTPANQIIEELAIFANYQAAVFCRQNDLLCLYRNQPPYSINRELEPGEKPTLRDIHIQPARIGMIPEGHSALGLDCYMQVTSPIRRFLDLINQSAIFSRLAERESGYASDDLLHWARVGEEVQREYAAIERRLLDHWKIKYLGQHPNDIYDAQLVRMLRNGKALIRILNIQLVVECVLDEPPRDTFRIMLDQVVPMVDRVIARLLPDVAEIGDSPADNMDPVDP